MEEAQFFRLPGKSYIEKIPCHQANDQTIIYWEDITQAFPGAKYVKNNHVAIELSRDSRDDIVVPHRIKHLPGVTLDVVLSTSGEDGPTTDSRSSDVTSSSKGQVDIVENLMTHLPADTSSGHSGIGTQSRSPTLSSTSPLLDIEESKALIGVDRPTENIYCENTSQKLDVDKLDEYAVDALAEATNRGSEFKQLELTRTDQLGDPFISNISRIVSRSELGYILVHTGEDEGRIRILESIQWKHIRKLDIYLEPGTFETNVMRTLVEGVTRMTGRAGLEGFWFYSETETLLVVPQGDLLQTFIASTSLRFLALNVDMTLEQVLVLLRSADVSRLEYLALWTKGFDSAKVDSILDGLRHATKLKTVRLLRTSITIGQKNRMKAVGVTLSEW
ncbi:hypothetical protein BGX34_005205 [Mortierella sp. NVP85]|nr:hypothetical protein BGX34_005205 [Mortierella sp. NVP85]